jgi:hypothetical protein
MTAFWLFFAVVQSILTYTEWYFFLRDHSFSPEIHALAHVTPLNAWTPIVGTAVSLLLWWRAYRLARRHEDDPL